MFACSKDLFYILHGSMVFVVAFWVFSLKREDAFYHIMQLCIVSLEQILFYVFCFANRRVRGARTSIRTLRTWRGWNGDDEGFR